MFATGALKIVHDGFTLITVFEAKLQFPRFIHSKSNNFFAPIVFNQPCRVLGRGLLVTSFVELAS